MQPLIAQSEGGDVDAKLLLKQFNAEAGLAFVQVIQDANGPIDARAIMAALRSVGAKPDTVRDKWSRAQKYINLHPNITKPTKLKYEWSMESAPSGVVLERLSSSVPKTVPSWLKDAYVNVIADSLANAETAGPNAQSTWSDERELQKAQVLGRAAAEAESLVVRGGSAYDIVSWLEEEATNLKLQRTVRVGDHIPFSPEEHDAEGALPKRGETVQVLRAGYRWISGSRNDLVVRAIVQAV
jgi:hypothetical protein